MYLFLHVNYIQELVQDSCARVMSNTFFVFQCRHLYYGQKLGGIKRINLDGSDTASEGDTFIVSPGLIDISGIAVDHRKNILYWAENTTSSNVIMHLNMTEWSRAYRLHDAKLVS